MNRRERKKARTEAEIVTAATVLFKQQGFEGTTMEQIAAVADISKGTLYNYFSAKEAILSLYWQDQMRAMQDEIPPILQRQPDTPTRLLKLFQSVMNMLASQRDLYQPYLRYRLQHLHHPTAHAKLRSGFDMLLLTILQDGQQKGAVRTDFPLPMLIRHLEGIFIQACMDWIADSQPSCDATHLKQALALFFEGAAVPPVPEKEL